MSCLGHRCRPPQTAQDDTFLGSAVPTTLCVACQRMATVAANVDAVQPTTPGEALSVGGEQGVTADQGSIHGLEDD